MNAGVRPLAPFLSNFFYLSLEVERVTPFLSREGSGICDQMLPPDLTSLSTKFSFLHRIETNLPTPAPTGSKRTDARFPIHYSFLPDSIGIAISREGATIDLRQ